MWELLIKIAEREGFKPPVRLRTAVFKTAAIDHSAISPMLFAKSGAKIRSIFGICNISIRKITKKKTLQAYE